MYFVNIHALFNKINKTYDNNPTSVNKEEKLENDSKIVNQKSVKLKNRPTFLGQIHN